MNMSALVVFLAAALLMLLHASALPTNGNGESTPINSSASASASANLNDACSSAPCQNGATCQSLLVLGVPVYKCSCAKNYFGTNCNTYYDPTGPCANNPCNTGTCYSVRGNLAYVCLCGKGSIRFGTCSS